ncbi:hypothetical protein [Parapedobacter sp. DT-150]|uniref:hypothetical protein n=1 Tax=Parapedobacter sp. DT-150 TaxID=3396162 RepID=UPI003F19F4CE
MHVSIKGTLAEALLYLDSIVPKRTGDLSAGQSGFCLEELQRRLERNHRENAPDYLQQWDARMMTSSFTMLALPQSQWTMPLTKKTIDNKG